MTPSPLRTRLCSSTALAIALLGTSRQATAAAFAGSPVVTSGTAAINRATTNLDRITVGGTGGNTAVITWTPTDTTGTGAVNFLPSGTTATFSNAAGVTDFTVINRVLPTNATGALTNRPTAYNGTISSFINSAGVNTPGGTVVFYTPGGIIIGPSAVINVGSLLLTTADPVLSGSAFTLNSALNSTNSVQIAAGAQVNAQSNYVALVAPRIQQGGAVTVAGGAAYIAAEQVDLTISGAGKGLFDIKIGAGSAGLPTETTFTALSHTGTTTGATPAAGTSPTIIMAAIPKNDAITMLVGGTVGFTPASGATVSGGIVELLAGLPTTENMTTPVSLRSGSTIDTTIAAHLNITASSTTNLYAEATQVALKPTFGTQTGLTQSLTGMVTILGRSATFVDNNGNTLTFGGDLDIGSPGDGSGRQAFINATEPGTLAIGGNLNVDLFSHGYGASQTGGSFGATAGVFGAGGTLSVAGKTTIDVSGAAYSGQGQGGVFGLTADQGGTLALTGGLSVDASGLGNGGTGGTGGTANVVVQGGGRLTAPSLSINADGSVSYGTASQSAQGGTATLAVGAAGSINVATLSLSASGSNSGGGNGLGGTTSLDIAAGTGSVTTSSSISLIASGTGGSGSGSSGTGGVGTGGQATIAVQGGTLSLQGSNANYVSLDASGTGGQGGYNGNYDGSAGLTGGQGTGGTAHFTVSGGRAQVTDLGVTADGIGGAGGAGAYASYGQPAGAGGVGGNGTGGAATLGVSGGGSLLTLTGPSSTFGGLTVRASGTGGQGGAGQTNSPPDDQGAMGGMGGSATGGTASLLVNLGGAIVGADKQQLNVVAEALPGSGGSGAYGNVTAGATGAGGLSATGGDASLTLDRGTVSFTDLVRLSALALPVGGAAQAGTATLALANGASLNAGSVIVDATPSVGPFTAAIGGTATVTLDNSSLVTPTMSITAGVPQEGAALAPNAPVSGGQATLTISNGGMLSVGTLGVSAAADASLVSVTPGHSGVVVTGGTSALTLSGGAQVSANDISVGAAANAGPATSVTAGAATVMVDGGTLGAANLRIDATGDPAGPPPAGSSVVTGGTAALDVGASGSVRVGNLQLLADATASGSMAAAGQTGTAAVGGTARLTIAVGNATVTADIVNLSATGIGGDAQPGGSVPAAAGSGTGGTATIALAGGTLTNSGSSAQDTTLVAFGRGGNAGTASSGTGSDGGAGGAGTGGTAAFSVTGGQATLNNLQLSADGNGGLGGGGDYALSGTGGAGGPGGAGTGGMVTVTASGGTLTLTGPAGGVNGFSLSTTGSGGNGGSGGSIGNPYASPPHEQIGLGGAGGAGGAATGGTASVLVDANGAIIGQGSAALALTSDAYSGYGGYGGVGDLNNYTNIGAQGPGGLSADSGSATLTVSNGASLNLTGSVGIEATAYGRGPGASGGTAAVNLLGGSMSVVDLRLAADATSNSGGAAAAGSAIVTINGGPSNLSTALTANVVTVTAAGLGNQQTGTYLPTIAVTGGTAAFDLGATGQVTVNSLQLTATGDATFGAAGATGRGGTARLTSAAGAATLNVSNFIVLDTSGYGATGGGSGTGGPGFGGNAGVFLAGGTLTLTGSGDGALSILAGGVGGPGYQPSDPVDGGAATGGTAQFVVSGAAIANLPAVTLSADATGGTGAPGLVLPSNVADAGGAGGVATGGTASFSATDSAQVNIGGKLTLNATAQGGYGGTGADGPAGATGTPGTPAEGTPEGPPVAGGDGGAGGTGGDGGTGGAGGAATGGQTSIAVTNGSGSGAQVVLGGLALLSTATAGGGGDGGMGGAGGTGGPGGAGANGGATGAQGATGAVGNGGAGGQGGDVTGGSAILNVASASLSTSATQIDATVAQTLGGAFGADGNGNASGFYAGYGNLNVGAGATLTMAGATPVALGDPVTIDAAGPVLLSAGATDAGFTASSLEATSNTSIVSNAPLGVDSASFTGNDVLGIGIPVSIGGAINATGGVTINTTGAVAIDAAVNADSLDAQTYGPIEVSGDLTLTTLNLQTFGDGAPITLTGNTSVSTMATIAAPGAISLDGPFSGGSDSTVTVTSETGIEASQSFAAGSITLTGDAPGAAVTLTGNTQATGPLAIVAQGAVALGGTIGAGDLGASSDTGIAVSGAITANDVALTGNPGTGATVDVAALGSIAAGNAVVLAGSGAVTLEGAVSGAALTFMSDTGVAAMGTLGGDTLTLTGTAPGATVVLGGTSAITGATTLAAPGLVTVSGSQQAGSFTAASDTGITVDGTIAATNGATTLTGNAGTTAGVTLTADGQLTGAATTITAPGAVLLNGGITGTDVVLVSDTDVTSTAGIGANTLTVTGTPPGATVTLAGATTVSGATMVTAPGAVALSGTLLGGGSLTATSDTSVSVADDQLNVSALTLTGTAPGATVTLGGNSTVTGTTALAAPGLITVAGNQQAGTFTAVSDTGIAVPGSIGATDVTLTGNSGTAATVMVAAGGSVTGATSATLAAPGVVILAGSVAAPTVSVMSATGINATGTLGATTLTLTGSTPGATVALGGSTAVTGSATVTAPGAVTLTGAFTGGGSLSASSATSVAVANSQLVAGSLTLTGTAPGATVSLGGNSTVAGTAALTAPTLVTLAGNQQAGTFTAASDAGINVTGAVAATDTTLTGNPGTAATVAVASTGSLAGSNSVTVRAPGAVTLDGAVAAPTLGVTSATSIASSAALTGRVITLTGTAPASTVTLTGAFTDTGAATITGPGGVALSGSFAGGGALSAVSDKLVAVNYGQLAASALTLSATPAGGSVILSGNTTVTGATMLRSSAALTLGGVQQAASFIAASDSGITVPGSVTAATIALTGNSGAGATVGVSGTVAATTSATITAPGALTLDGAVSAPTLSLTSGTGIAAAGALSGTTLALTGTGTTSTVTLTGSLTDTGTATITAPGAAALSGTFAGGGALSAASGTSVAVNYPQFYASALTLTGTAPGATVALNGNSTVTGATRLAAPSLITVSGSQQAGTFTAASDTGISVPGSITATDIILTGNTGTNATIAVTPTGLLTAANSATILVPGAVTLDGAVSAPTLSVTGGSIGGGGALAASTLSVTALGGAGAAVTLGGSEAVTGSATIVAPGAVTLTGAFTGGGSLSASSAISVAVTDSQLVASALTLEATGAASTVSLAGGTTVGGTTRLIAPGTITVDGNQQAGSFIARSSTDLSVAGTITAASVTLNGGAGTGGAVTVLPSGSVTASGAVTISGGGLVTVDGPVAGGDIYIGSDTGVSVTAALSGTTLVATANGFNPAAPVSLSGGGTFTGDVAVQTLGPLTLAGAKPFGARTLTLYGGSQIELGAPVTATDVVVTGTPGVTTVSVDAPVSVANSFSVANAATFTANATIDPDNITIDVSGLITVNSLLAATRVTLDSGDIAIAGAGQVQAVELAEFLTSSPKASAATVGGTGGVDGYDLDAGELTHVAANRILVSTGPSSGHTSSGTTFDVAPLDLTVLDLSLAGSAGDNRNLSAGPRDPVLAFAAFGAVNVHGQVALTTAGTNDTVVLFAGGTARVATPTGGITITDPSGALTGEIYAYGSSVVVASDALAAALPGTAPFDDRATLLRTNDGPVAPAGYLQAGRIEIRPTTAFYGENSGTTASFAGLTTSDGGLGITAGTFDPVAAAAAGGITGVTSIDTLDAALVRTGPAEVIAYGRQVTSSGAVVINGGFSRLVRTTTSDVTPPSTVNDCIIPGGICASPPPPPPPPPPPALGAYQGTPVVGQGTATFVRAGGAAGDGRDLITIGGSTPATVITWTPYDSRGTGPVDFLPTGNVATFTGAAGLTGYTVINRVLPTDATRPILFDGTTLATLTSTAGLATPGGTVVFFSPGGIVVGPTGVFNVGSLLLTTADPQGLGNGFRLNGAAGSTAAVTVQPGALITAATPGGFVELVAPRIRQDGTVSTAGDALYVAAEAADVTANADGTTAIVLSTGSAVGTDPLLLEHSGTTTGVAAAGGNIVLAAAGQDAPALVQAGGTLGYAGAGQVTVAAGAPTGLTGISAGAGLATQRTDLALGGSVTSPLVAQATGSVTVATPTNAPAQFGPVSLAFGGDLLVTSPLTATSLAAHGTGTASAVTINAAVTAPVIGITTAGPVTFAAPVTAANSLTVNTPGLLTITSAVDPATIVFDVGDIAIGATGRVGDANTQEIAILTDGGRATAATVGGAAGAAGFDLDAGEFGRLQASRILVSTGLGTTTRPLDLHIARLTVQGSASAANNLTPGTAPAVVFASSGGLFVDGELAVAGAGSTDTLGLLAAGRLAVTLPAGGIALTSPTGTLAGRLYLLGSDVVAASAATQATVAAATTFADRRSAIGLNDGAVNDAGYLQAGTVDVRAGSSFLNQNSGGRGVYAGISVGAGGLGFRQGVFATPTLGLDLTDLTAVDAAVRTTAPAEVIAFGRQVTGPTPIVNAAFLPTVRLTVTDVTLPSEINGCPIRGGACRDPLGDGTPMDRAAQLTGQIVRPAEDNFISALDEAGAVNAFVASQVGAFTAPRLIDLSAVTITAGIGDPATGAGDETLWDPLGLVPSATDTPAGPSDGRVGRRPAVPPARPSGSPGR